LGVPRREAEARARELLALVGLSDKEQVYPRQLSGGQQQRVAIARALALDPKVLLFDEPTSALDPELVEEVLAVIRSLARAGTTLVIVTHEIPFARDVADTVVFMDRGRIVEQGPPGEVLDHPRHERTRSLLHRVRTGEETPRSGPDTPDHLTRPRPEDRSWPRSALLPGVGRPPARGPAAAAPPPGCCCPPRCSPRAPPPRPPPPATPVPRRPTAAATAVPGSTPPARRSSSAARPTS